MNEDDHDRYSDESTFMLISDINIHNCRYWSDGNPHLMMETHSQTKQNLRPEFLVFVLLNHFSLNVISMDTHT